jgi:hypothetical protein
MSMGQYEKAIALHQEHKKIAEEVGDRSGVGGACANLGNCYFSMRQYVKRAGICVHRRRRRSCKDCAAEADAAP